MERYPDFAKAHFQLGNALAKLGQSAEARKEHALGEHIEVKERAEYQKKLNSAPTHP